MLLAQLLLSLIVNCSYAVLSIPDRYTTIDKVELANNIDPSDIVVSVHQRVNGCRTVREPTIMRRNKYIQVFLQTESASSGRAPCQIKSVASTQSVHLGSLPKGTYRLRVITEESQIAKVLNIY